MTNHNEFNRFRIVRRAFSQYTDVACVFGISRLDALGYAYTLEQRNADGEYLVREINEPNWTPSSSYQSGFDFL